MNERIRELALQAGVNLSAFQFPGTPIKYEVSESELKKFAELIVRECADLRIDYGTDDYYRGWLDYREEIKRHFGVGE